MSPRLSSNEAMVLAVLVQIDVVRGVGRDGGVDTA
jgi:hypothetical protein